MSRSLGNEKERKKKFHAQTSKPRKKKFMLIHEIVGDFNLINVMK
jgi:hypothetical protein